MGNIISSTSRNYIECKNTNEQDIKANELSMKGHCCIITTNGHPYAVSWCGATPCKNSFKVFENNNFSY